MSDRFRNTVQRTEVLDVVLASEGHLTAGEIFERVRRQDPKIAYGTVYRALHLLAERGMIREFGLADAFPLSGGPDQLAEGGGLRRSTGCHRGPCVLVTL
jgi:Fe2+ or Zn2+ uptake regulation protein